ncbi:MAG: M20/M25/M40 family metallo-hydrolase [Flavobacteriales bacterium]|jgi:putative aminopeptidase FrvX|nr:M20/M25/M40 family metallo-hydrolase [Flavobacteriales bacterium]MDG1439995.1 M20/M25/M40 family metallo-hydrolase [Flavobacteriales bacterium]MDG1798484.1 M20/M25/M40 family metallo-hydrolase [Flavobacteriales bacterium]
MELLQKLCSIAAPSGNEAPMKKFILEYLNENISNFKVKPIVISDGIQDCLVLKFGKPKTAVFAHLDSIGFTVRYDKELVKIGGPKSYDGIKLVGKDSIGEIETEIYNYEDDHGNNHIEYLLDREIDRATELTFKPNWREDDQFIQCCYMDNRLGVWNALEIAKTLENGIICFSTYEEVGGGSVGFLGKYIYEKWGVNQALISDITWVTNGVKHGEGVVISRRDSGLPRRSYVDRIIEIADKSNIPYQIEVESTGGSDGNQLQKSPYPFDWCFIGAPEDFVHSPDEKVHKNDVKHMVELYQLLMQKL